MEVGLEGRGFMDLEVDFDLYARAVMASGNRGNRSNEH